MKSICFGDLPRDISHRILNAAAQGPFTRQVIWGLQWTKFRRASSEYIGLSCLFSLDKMLHILNHFFWSQTRH
jgi:hypothetical protein